MTITLKYRRSAGSKNRYWKYLKNTSPELKPTVMETLTIGRRRSIALIQVGNKRMLIGSTPHTINLLKSFPESFFHGSDQENPRSQSASGSVNKNTVRNLFEVKKESPA